MIAEKRFDPIAMGQRIRAKREELGWTMEQLIVALRRVNPTLKTKPSSLHNIERGDVKSPTIIYELSEALGVSPHWIKTGEGAPTRPPPGTVDIRCLSQMLLAVFDYLGVDDDVAHVLQELVLGICEARQADAPALDEEQARRILTDQLARQFLRTKPSK